MLAFKRWGLLQRVAAYVMSAFQIFMTNLWIAQFKKKLDVKMNTVWY